MPAHDLTAARPQFRKYLRGGTDSRVLCRAAKLASRPVDTPIERHPLPQCPPHRRTCLVCFRPALVYNVRRGKRLQFTVLVVEAFNVKHVREIPIRANA